jgi:hypothetical protein
MLRHTQANREVCRAAASDPALLATDLADYLVAKGTPFRQAHHAVGSLVAAAEKLGKRLSVSISISYRRTAIYIPGRQVYEQRRARDADVAGWALLRSTMNTNTRLSFRIVRLFATPARLFTPHAPDRGCRRSVIPFQNLTLTVQLLAFLVLLASLRQAVAAATIVSTVPTNGATGVLPGAAVVFNFSTAMNPAATSVLFSDVTASNESPTVVSGWSAGNTVLTCNPYPQFANNHYFVWSVSGQDTAGNFLTGPTGGSFTTVMGVNGGSGTNVLTTFLLTKYALYRQTTNAPPPLLTYEFVAQSALASNRTAAAISVMIPATPPRTNFLVEELLLPEQYQTNVFKPTLTNFDTNFPTVGNYVFNITNSFSNQQVTVTLPNVSLPNAPQIINYNNAQAVNPSLPFTLNWNTFTNGGSADRIVLQINAPSQNGNSGMLLFQTSLYGPPDGLDGTATLVTIPAGVLPANFTNDAFVVFAHVISTTNATTQTTAIVGSATYFTIVTTAASAAPLLTIIRSGTNALLEWPTNAAGYSLAFSSNLTSSVWSTNLPAPVVVNSNNVVTNAISGTGRFFRLHGS